jgi:hypothetical protein
MDWRVDFYEAKWHLSVANRMLESYDGYPDKRFLVGVIREGAKAAGKLVRSFLIREGVKGDLKIFLKKVAPKYLDEVTIGNLVKILEVERAQRISRVEFVRRDKIILLIEGKYQILTVARLKEFVGSIEIAVKDFSADIKR